jgi:hypothetical protein
VAEKSPASLAAGMYKVCMKYGGCTTAFISEKISVSRTHFTLANLKRIGLWSMYELDGQRE